MPGEPIIGGFHCKEPGCDQVVKYERKTIPALHKLELASDQVRKKKVVYLECAKGHTHPYTVEEGS